MWLWLALLTLLYLLLSAYVLYRMFILLRAVIYTSTFMMEDTILDPSGVFVLPLLSDPRKDVSYRCLLLILDMYNTNFGMETRFRFQDQILQYEFVHKKEIIGRVYRSDQNEDTMWIVFRGTITWYDVLKDTQRVQVFLDNGIGIHDGFYELFTSVIMEPLGEILRKHPEIRNVLCTGHSLGAALAAVIISHFSSRFPSLRWLGFLYGCPRIGNDAFVRTLDRPSIRMYSIKNSCDMIPNTPLAVTVNFVRYDQPYLYTDIEPILTFTDNRRSWEFNHAIYTYLRNAYSVRLS